MNVPTTGSAAFIGSALHRHRVSTGETVLYASEPAYPGNLPSLRPSENWADHLPAKAIFGEPKEQERINRILYLAAVQ